MKEYFLVTGECVLTAENYTDTEELLYNEWFFESIDEGLVLEDFAMSSIESYGREQGWWNNPKKNPVAYFMHRVDGRVEFNFASNWLSEIRNKNKCAVCRKRGSVLEVRGINRCFECEYRRGILYKDNLLGVTCPKCTNKATKYGKTDKISQGNYGQRYKCADKKCRYQFTFGRIYALELKKEKAVIMVLAQDYNFSQAEGVTGIPRQTIRKWVVAWLTTLPIAE